MRDLLTNGSGDEKVNTVDVGIQNPSPLGLLYGRPCRKSYRNVQTYL